jgi:hypothetical protein
VVTANFAMSFTSRLEASFLSLLGRFQCEVLKRLADVLNFVLLLEVSRHLIQQLFLRIRNKMAATGRAGISSPEFVGH